MTERTVMDIQRVYIPLMVAAAMLVAVFVAARQVGTAEGALASVQKDVETIDRRISRMEDKLDRLLFVDSETEK